MVHVCAVNITDLPDPLEDKELMEKLPENRKRKIMSCRQPEARQQSLGAGLLLQYVLRDYRLTEQDITVGQYGKPEVEGVCFNVSHSGDMVVCAVSEYPVGCDIEKITTVPERVAERFFSKGEVNYLNQVPKEAEREEFFRLWTMKESYIKMTGEGLHLPLNQFELCLGEDVRVCRDGEIQNCFFKEYEISGYRLTVCAKENQFQEKIEEPLDVKRG